MSAPCTSSPTTTGSEIEQQMPRSRAASTQGEKSGDEERSLRTCVVRVRNEIPVGPCPSGPSPHDTRRSFI